MEQRGIGWRDSASQSQNFVGQGQTPYFLAEKLLTSYCGTSCKNSGDGATHLQKGVLVELSDDESDEKIEPTSIAGMFSLEVCFTVNLIFSLQQSVTQTLLLWWVVS
jgi:hypothetical protein